MSDGTTTTLRWQDPRDLVEIAVLMGDGRLAPRQFADRAQAEAWARPQDGDEVVELRTVCQCTL